MMSDRHSLYTKLDASARQIRLVALLPGSWDDAISCVLEVGSLNASPGYEALSYAWGTADATCPIEVGNHTIKVTPSLEAVLRRLRKASESRLLWIDQISIDQENNDDKSQQVMLMKDIYSQADRVIIWLGESDDSTEDRVTIEQAEASENIGREKVLETGSGDQVGDAKATETLHPIREAVRLLTQLSEDVHPTKLTYYFHVTGNNSIEPTSAFLIALEGLTSLVDRSWWNRTWVLQECILAKKAIVVTGSYIVPLEIFEKGSSNWTHHQVNCCTQAMDSLPLESRNKLLHIIPILNNQKMGRDVHSGGTQIVLVDLMRIFRNREATDDRDKVYALLSLVTSWLYADPLTIDYSRTTLEVYADVMVNCIEMTRSLFVLTSVRSLRPGFPTWVQDWAARGDAFKHQRDGHGNVFNAYYKASPSYHPSPKVIDKSILSLYGIYVDTVSQLGDSCLAMDWHALVPTFKQWIQIARADEDANKPYVGGGTVQEAFARTMVGDLKHSLDGFNRLGQESIMDSYSAWWALCQEAKAGDWMLDGEGDFSFFYTRTSPSVCMLRRFYITSKGYMGIGPLEMSVGDQVHILIGGNVPFLLRHQDNKTVIDNSSKVCRYKLIGDCYLHGIMDGEGFSKESIQPVQLV